MGLYRSTSEKPDAELVQDWPAAAGQKSFVGTAKIPLAAYLKPGEERVTFCLVARDANDATGPGVTISRPLTVAVATAEKLRQQAADAAAKLALGLRALVKLQTTNLEETTAAQNAPGAAAGAATALVDRQVAVGDAAGSNSRRAPRASRRRCAKRCAGSSRERCRPAALTLRNAASAPANAQGALLAAAGGWKR